MLAGTRHHTRVRRGIVLVLVLAMLGLLALIGVTFATFSGQARINARNFAQSVLKPQADELLDFALLQLITDTADPRSVIRGHSLARDMFGNDAFNNGYLTVNPAGGAYRRSRPQVRSRSRCRGSRRRATTRYRRDFRLRAIPRPTARPSSAMTSRAGSCATDRPGIARSPASPSTRPAKS